MGYFPPLSPQVGIKWSRMSQRGGVKAYTRCNKIVLGMGQRDCRRWWRCNFSLLCSYADCVQLQRSAAWSGDGGRHGVEEPFWLGGKS